ncbi:MAG: ABC transporter permease, partial [Bacteroidota bacterium]
MNKKISLIIKREYLTRVRKPSFWLLSLLAPLFMGAIVFVPILLASIEGEQKVIAVLNQVDGLSEEWKPRDGITWEFVDGELNTELEKLVQEDYYALLFVPENFLEKGNAQIYGQKSVSISVKSDVRRELQSRTEELRLNRAGIDKTTLEDARAKVNIEVASVPSEEEVETGETKGGVSPEAATIVGYFTAFVIYFFIFLFGAQVMRSVVEEKTNRIVEVIISSVKPFELMMGKIVGMGAVALTQFVIWAVMLVGIQVGLGAFVGAQKLQGSQAKAGIETPAAANEAIQDAEKILDALGTLDFPVIIATLAFYFLAAYLFYGALFAAVGAASDNDTDTQQFMLPISLPLIAAIIMASYVIREPQGSIAFWGSMIPFTSPIIMMMRVPFGVPIWELLLSMSILTVSFIGS